MRTGNVPSETRPARRWFLTMVRSVRVGLGCLRWDKSIGKWK